MKPVTFLLIPGLNDTKPITKWFYSWICRLWGQKGWQAQVCFMDWEGNEAYDDKLRKIEVRASSLVEQGRSVVVVGVSAGATLAMLSFAEQRATIAGVVTICGLLRLATGDDKKVELFHKSWFKAAQACQTAVAQLSDAQKKRIVCVVPIRDAVISPNRAQVDGAGVVRMRSVGHLTSIFIALVWYRRKIWRYSDSFNKPDTK